VTWGDLGRDWGLPIGGTFPLRPEVNRAALAKLFYTITGLLFRGIGDQSFIE